MLPSRVTVTMTVVVDGEKAVHPDVEETDIVGTLPSTATNIISYLTPRNDSYSSNEIFLPTDIGIGRNSHILA